MYKCIPFAWGTGWYFLGKPMTLPPVPLFQHSEETFLKMTHLNDKHTTHFTSPKQREETEQAMKGEKPLSPARRPSQTHTGKEKGARSEGRGLQGCPTPSLWYFIDVELRFPEARLPGQELFCYCQRDCQ